MSSPSSSSPLPQWLAELLFGTQLWAGSAATGWRTVADDCRSMEASADAGERMGIDLVHGLAAVLLAAGAFVFAADIELVTDGQQPPMAFVAGILRGLFAHGAKLRRIACDKGNANAVRVRLLGPSVAALRPPAVGDDIVAIGGAGIVRGDAELAARRGQSVRSARSSPCSVLHHPLREGLVGGLVPVDGPLLAALTAALPTGLGAELGGALPSSAAHRVLAGGGSALEVGAVCTAGVRALAFAPPAAAAKIVDHVRLWNEPAAVLGRVVADVAGGVRGEPCWLPD